MSLFKPDEIAQPEMLVQPKAKALRHPVKTEGAELNSLTMIRETVGPISDGDAVPYFSKGAWSNHDLLEYLLEMSGPAVVWLSTWGIGEEAFRKIHHLMNQGKITELNCLFDHRISQEKAKELQLVKGMANRIVFMKNHSKVFAVQGVNASFSVFTSANFTNNPRMEAGVIFRSKTVTDFTSEFIRGEIEGN